MAITSVVNTEKIRLNAKFISKFISVYLLTYMHVHTFILYMTTSLINYIHLNIHISTYEICIYVYINSVCQ
jgi:hypothetical protein